MLNLTRNRLSSLPAPNNDSDFNRIEELYLAFNCANNNLMEVISGYRRLRVLDLSYNELTELYDRCCHLITVIMHIILRMWQLGVCLQRI